MIENVFKTYKELKLTFPKYVTIVTINESSDAIGSTINSTVEDTPPPPLQVQYDNGD